MQLYADAEPDAYSTTNCYSNANPEPNSDRYTNCDPDGYPNANGYPDSNSHTDSDAYPHTNPNSCAGSGHDLSQRLTEWSRDSNRRGQLLSRVKCYSKGNAGQQLFHVRGLV
jgi:hypothetical protein